MDNDRFWRRVEKTDGCWNWTGGKSKAGYGYAGTRARHIYAHRLSWEIHNGAIPAGLLVCHRCDNPSCVRPDHLFLGDYSTNALDSVAKGRASMNLPAERPKGEAHPDARLKESDVRNIRERWARRSGQRSGLGRQLAKEYGVSHRTISAVVRRKSWRHLP